ncbi:PP2C-domain-containing protein [Choiromyces venosus 120613-1]|uniref:PP2C-domain-containing protein n=1 Tax=Choiromyces venosus 120613-1 TaxID=1336337 RepID=A0A3N4JIQ3_9PEZI|nr:PP2C-domain-containing protein [Choiromyces venosus 120613-1]
MFGNNHPSPANDAEASSTAKVTNPPAPPPLNTAAVTPSPPSEKKRRGSVSKASAFITSARNSLSGLGSSIEEKEYEKAIKQDPNTIPVGPHNNSAGDSRPGPKSTFRVGVTEDKNKKCRRTMEDTHSYLYNFLQSPTSKLPGTSSSTGTSVPGTNSSLSNEDQVDDSDNGYFAIFDGHAGTYAADWCGKKLHLVLEETIRKNPNTPIPELLDITFTNCDGQLEKLPVKNSGCTAVCAVLRWEERRLPNAPTEATKENRSSNNENVKPTETAQQTERQRVLYTANVGDARIVLCRNGQALRLSYDHKGSDENEGKRVADAGGLILNNRVNVGVLAVTRALGDSYMKELVTGHPFTTETVLQPEADEFIILACDGLWDVCSDQEAVNLVRQVQDPQEASKMLVDYALGRFSSDNLSCMIVRLDPTGKFNDIKANSNNSNNDSSSSSEPKEQITG